jgi:hypothetical protein
MVVHLPKGTPVATKDEPHKEVGKVIATRPLRVEGQVVSHIYAVQSNGAGPVIIMMNEEILQFNQRLIAECG